MKICMLSSMHPALDKRVFEKEAVSLVNAGFDVTHLCPGNEKKKFVSKGVKIVTFESHRGMLKRFFHLKTLYRLAKQINADAYHCNEVDSWIVGVFLHIFNNKYCVFDVHEDYPNEFSQVYFSLVFQPFVRGSLRFLYRVLCSFTDGLVFAKESVAFDFKFECDNKKVLVRNYAPIGSFDFLDHQLFKKKITMPLTLVHFGLLSKSRGWPQILEALSLMKHQNLKFLIIGVINDNSQVEFDRRVIELNLSERVEIIPWMPYQEALICLSKANIGIVAFQPHLLNNVYAMPHKVFDYMACGLPVLVPECAVEIAPIIKETEAGFLFDSTDAAALSKILDNILEDTSILKIMGKNGQDAILKKYNWESEAKKLIDMYLLFS